MRPILLVAAFVLAAAALPAAQAAPAATADYVVALSALPADRASWHGHAVVGANDALGFLVVRGDARAIEARAVADANVRWIEPDAEIYSVSLVPNDQFYAGYQYSMKPAATNMEAAWSVTLGSTAVKVSVVDTGQYRGHQDFATTTWGAWRDFVRGKATAYDDNGHGTHVTGTIAANTNNGKGVAGISQSTILGAKVCGASGSCSVSAMANGITWSADNGAHIISMSIGGGFSSTVHSAVQYAVSTKGALFVAAAGNGGCSNCVEYPAAHAESVAVSCSDAASALCGFSSTGPEVDFIAPGDDIPSTYPPRTPCGRKDTNCYVLMSGTSMSTPHVSGLAALVKATHPAYTQADLRAAMAASARDLGLPASQQGAGLIQGTAA